MALRERLDADLREALRSGDETHKSTLRLLLSAVRNAEVPPKPADLPDEASAASASYEPSGPRRLELSDADILDVIRREVKQRRDSIDAYSKARRPDLAAREEAELQVLATYLPAQMSRAEIEQAARAVIERVGARGPGDKGKVMAAIMAELRDKAEGREINAVVTELLAAKP